MTEPSPENSDRASEVLAEGSQSKKTSKTTPQMAEEEDSSEPMSSTSGTCLSPTPSMKLLSESETDSPPKATFRKKNRTIEGAMMLEFKNLKRYGEDWSVSDYDSDLDSIEFNGSDYDFDTDDENTCLEIEAYTEEPVNLWKSSRSTNTTPPPNYIPVSLPVLRDEEDENFMEVVSVPIPRLSFIPRKVMTERNFLSFNLSGNMVENLRANLGVITATFLQEEVVPLLKCERDTCIRGARGTGKTLAVLVSVIHNLSLIRPKVCTADGVRVLVVVPIRDMVEQTYEMFMAINKDTPWIVIVKVGGNSTFTAEQELIRQGCIILIGTPSRIMDHIRFTSGLYLKNISCVVMDGIDQMYLRSEERNLTDLMEVLEKGLDYLIYPDYLRNIRTEHMETTRQIILVSSVYSTRVERFAELNMTDRVNVDDPFATVPNGVYTSPLISRWFMKLMPALNLPPQYYMVLPEKMRLVGLIAFIVWKFKVLSEERIIIYFGTQVLVDFYGDFLNMAFKRIAKESEEEELEEEEEPVDCMLSDIYVYKLMNTMNANIRSEVVDSFNKTKKALLLTTDYVMRTVHQPSANWVIHFHPPPSMYDYMRRIRVADKMPGPRMNSTILFLLPSELKYLELLENIEVSVTELRIKKFLKHLWHFYTPSDTMKDILNDIQGDMENIVKESPYLYDRGSLAFASWRRFYRNYPQNMKEIFQIKRVHLDNLARSYGLSSPASIILARVKVLYTNTQRRLLQKKIFARTPMISVETQTEEDPHEDFSSSSSESEDEEPRQEEQIEKENSESDEEQPGTSQDPPQKVTK